MIDTEELMKKVARLRLLATRLVDDEIAGAYQSSFKGRGMAFDELREYVAGDDVRAIDWNATARRAVPFIKRFAEERELTVMLLVDVSGSLSFGSTGRTKAETAAEIACLLAFASVRNQDNVGLILFSDKVEKLLPPRKGDTAVQRIVREILAADRPEGKTDIAVALECLAKVQRRRAVVFLISDFQCDGWEAKLGPIAKRHDLVCCPVSDPIEADIPPAGLLEIEDPETGETFWVDTSSNAVRDELRSRSQTRKTELSSLFRRHGIDVAEFSSGGDVLTPIRTLFRARERRTRRRR